MPDLGGVRVTAYSLIDSVIDSEGLLGDATGEGTVPSGAADGPTVDASHLVGIILGASPSARAATARGLADAVVTALEEGELVAARAAACALVEFVEQLPTAAHGTTRATTASGGVKGA